MPQDNSLFSQEKRKSCLRRDSNPRRSAYQADALPTAPLRQLSWAGRIFECYVYVHTIYVRVHILKEKEHMYIQLRERRIEGGKEGVREREKEESLIGYCMDH